MSLFGRSFARPCGLGILYFTDLTRTLLDSVTSCGEFIDDLPLSHIGLGLSERPARTSATLLNSHTGHDSAIQRPPSGLLRPPTVAAAASRMRLISRLTRPRDGGSLARLPCETGARCKSGKGTREKRHGSRRKTDRRRPAGARLAGPVLCARRCLRTGRYLCLPT